MGALRQSVFDYTIQEYLAFENASVTRHEYFQGDIYAMAGGTKAHNSLCVNITSTLHSQLRGKPCRVHSADMRLNVEAADLFTYPDVMIVCPPEKVSQNDKLAVPDATVIVEVLSPSTAQYDKTRKFDFYCQLPSFRHYLLVEQAGIKVEHRYRNGDGEWQSETFESLDDEVALSAVECHLKLSDIYEAIEF